MRSRDVAIAAMALAACSACKGAPEERIVSHDAAPSVSSSAPAVDASVAAEPPDAGASPVARAFCEGAYMADIERLRDKCAPADFTVSNNFARAAANLCTTDIGVASAGDRVSFDDGAAKKCVEMLRATPLSMSSPVDSIFAHAPCDRVLAGKQGEGDKCLFSVECKDGLACVGYRIGQGGVCKKPPAAKEACTPQRFGTILNEQAGELRHPACAKGAWCDGKTCQRRIPAGQACTAGDSCAEGLACIGGRKPERSEGATAGETLGKCGRRAVAGGSCGRAGDCVYGLWCNQNRCAAKKGSGETCASMDECKGSCDLPRNEADASAPGKCVPVCGSG